MFMQPEPAASRIWLRMVQAWTAVALELAGGGAQLEMSATPPSDRGGAIEASGAPGTEASAAGRVDASAPNAAASGGNGIVPGNTGDVPPGVAWPGAPDVPPPLLPAVLPGIAVGCHIV
jgi:hypothetical protein